MKIAGKLLFDFDLDNIAQYVMDVAVSILEAFGDAAAKIVDTFVTSFIVPFIGKEIISDPFWIGLLMIWLISTLIVVEKSFGWRK